MTKVAVTEMPYLNSDKDFKVADIGFALTQVYKIDTSLNWENQARIRVFLRIYQGERPFPKQHKSLFHSLSLNSQVSFTFIVLFESFL